MIKEVSIQSLGFLCCIVAALALDWVMTGFGLSSQSVLTGSLASAGLLGVACLADRLHKPRR
jgi:hypothetical protein